MINYVTVDIDFVVTTLLSIISIHTHIYINFILEKALCRQEMTRFTSSRWGQSVHENLNVCVTLTSS